MIDWLKKKLGGGSGDSGNRAASEKNRPSPAPSPAPSPSVTFLPLPDDDRDPTCVGRWARLIPEDGQSPYVGFIYVDPQQGMTIRLAPPIASDLANGRELPPGIVIIMRLPIPGALTPLENEEIAARQLPDVPEGMHHYGPQPRPRAPWRADEVLRPRLNPNFPDDIQVLVHDGEPRRTKRKLEECWVRITGAFDCGPRHVLFVPGLPVSEEEFARRYPRSSTVYSGTLLNQPHFLETVKEGDTVHFIAGGGVPRPLMVTEQYLAERSAWGMSPCAKCGFSECLDPPSLMFHTRFPDTPPGAEPQSFSSFCNLCGGIQLLAKLRD